ncbi:MAG: type IV toxin-antitoxin system AbiEi family antitoxin domain-containing protein [Acidobacteria bacterium]|nr:type IV toxin-antitoxin system AbiEi family antitoxin domain-containing protein [Acidobacteriota bacterium]
MDLNALFRQQHGLVTRRQALDVGLTERQIDRRLQCNDWVCERRGVYRLAGVAPSWECGLLAAVFSAGGVASHRCAAALWGLERFSHPAVELSVPYERRVRIEGIALHRSRQWDRRDETSRRGIPCTGINRTIIDCGAVTSVRTLEIVAESAIRKGHTSWNDLVRTLSQHSRQGRDGCGRLRALLELRLGNRTVPLSMFSRLVAEVLVASGIPRPELEYRIEADGAFILQADLAWPELKKAWELDGLQFHSGRTEIERDRRKRNRAKAEGWNIQEILWSMYLDERPQLVEMARKFLAS